MPHPTDMLPLKFKKNELESFFKDDKKLKALYDKLSPLFQRLTLNNSGSTEDAKDLLQESIILCYSKIQEPDFTLTSKLDKFIIGIGKRKWMHELRKQQKGSIINLEIEEKDDFIDELLINAEKRNLYTHHFNSLPVSCRKVLTFFFEGLNMKEIADRLNFKSEGYARKRKHNCQTKLIQSIKEDKRYKELRNE